MSSVMQWDGGRMITLSASAMNKKSNQETRVITSCRKAERVARSILLFLLLNLLFARTVSGSDVFNEDKAGFATIVRPFLQKNCVRCHGSEAQEGDFRVDELATDMSQRHIAEKWYELLNRINKGEMPPEGEPVPDSDATIGNNGLD